jgi:hypothetical protein
MVDDAVVAFDAVNTLAALPVVAGVQPTQQAFLPRADIGAYGSARTTLASISTRSTCATRSTFFAAASTAVATPPSVTSVTTITAQHLEVIDARIPQEDPDVAAHVKAGPFIRRYDGSDIGSNGRRAGDRRYCQGKQ